MFRWIEDSPEALLVLEIETRQAVAWNAAASALLSAQEQAAPVPLARFGRLEGDLEQILGRPAIDHVPLLLQPADGAADLQPPRVRVSRLTDRHCLLTLSRVARPTLQHLLRDILNELPAAIEIYDSNLNGIFYNRMADDLFLYDDRMISHHDEWWDLGFPDPAARAAAYAEWQEKFARLHAEPGSIQFSEWSVRCRDGSTRIVQFRYRLVGDLYVLALWDVTSERETVEKLRTLAGSDPLTGLGNRRRLIDAAQTEVTLAAGGGPACALLLIDIDHFKRINDRHGHGAGDAVLQKVAQRGVDLLRKSDLMARIGGEEFAVLLPATGLPEAQRVAERLLAALRQPVVLADGTEIELTASVGIARSAGERDFGVLMERCDRALYRAKQQGRDRVVCDEA